MLILLLIFPALNSWAQNLTGTWEGDLGSDQFLQLNIIQTGDKICGYTYDRVKTDRKSFCKAFFEGRFDRQRKMLLIDGKYFLQNSGSHILMKLSLNYKTSRGVEILEEIPRPGRIFSDMLRSFGFGDDDPFQAQATSQYVYIKKVADQPYELIELMKDCIARDKKKTDTVVKKTVPPKKDSVPPVVKVIIPDKPKDSVPPVITAQPVEKKADSIALPKAIEQRKNKEQSRIEVDVKTINLKVYDNAIMDGDTVSILYNGKMLLSHQLLSEKGIDLNIELDETQTRHEITLFAENLGSIPPNTALIVITAGTKRYELFASASLEENAVLVFEYKPK
ncbi:MAG: hypothetical protein JNM14_14160 [Ferruginibacter sp.]|nr:hypothetical protein [Ferruginibacter sp.]